MATSGNTIAAVTRQTIVNSALRKLVVLGEGVVASTEQVTTAAEALNMVVSEFRALGMTVFSRRSLNIPLVSGQATYTLGIGQPINVPYPMFIYDAEMVVGPVFTTKILMNPMPIVNFNQLPLGSSGTPVNYTYQPLINTGRLSVWPTPDVSVPATSYIAITYHTPYEVFDSATDDMDFPQEWANALVYNLALSLCDEYGVSDSKFTRIKALADGHLGVALSNSNEQGSLFLQPDNHWRR